MTLDEYRIQHSMLIEQYQWIEFDLEGICAVLSEEPFHEAIREIEKDSIGGIVREIQRMEEKLNVVAFTAAEYEAIDRLRERRNFWSHECYTEAWDKHTGVPRNADLLAADLKSAQTLLKQVRRVKELYMELQRDGRI